MTVHTHVIPVPDGMTPDDASGEIRIFGELAEGRIVEEDGTEGCRAVITCEATASDCLGDEGWADIVGRLMERRREASGRRG